MESIISKVPDMVMVSVQKLWDDIKAQIEYSTCVLDVWIELNDGILDCHLIEINSYGRWGPAGSSLYNWIDHDPLSGDLELRIRSKD